MQTFVVTAFFGGMVGAIVLIWVLAWYEARPEAQRIKALEYAAWLALAYPDIPVQEAAQLRYISLSAKSHYVRDKDRDEMVLARLVMDGWHLKGLTK